MHGLSMFQVKLPVISERNLILFIMSRAVYRRQKLLIIVKEKKEDAYIIFRFKLIVRKLFMNIKYF